MLPTKPNANVYSHCKEERGSVGAGESGGASEEAAVANVKARVMLEPGTRVDMVRGGVDLSNDLGN